MSDNWRYCYDAWKLRAPDWDQPDPECADCDDAGCPACCPTQPAARRVPGRADMIEIRGVAFGKNRQLEYRYAIPSVDASGAFCPPYKWSPWYIAPTIDGDCAAYEDMCASGGIQEAP